MKTGLLTRTSSKLLRMIDENSFLSMLSREAFLRMRLIHLFLSSKVFKKPVVTVIGDSHTVFFNKRRGFIVFHIGPATAYYLKSEKSTTNSSKWLFSVLKQVNKERDCLILVFGEIDCRIHIYNQHRKSHGGVTISEAIDRTIASYGIVLERVACSGFDFYVHGVPPASRQENVYGYRYYAPPEVRSGISREFNERLRDYCERHQYKYIDIYRRVVGQDGFTLKEFMEGDTHLNRKALELVEESLPEV